MKLRILLTLIFFLSYYLFISAQHQEINISKKLKVTQLTDNTYLHTSNNNNGIIYHNNGEAIIVSTPDYDEETLNLINWVKDNLQVKIIAYIIDRWHPDAMGGLNIVHQAGIKSYANELTRTIAKNKKLPVPQIGFKKELEFKVGNKKIICDYLGESHTEDGIVVWISDDKILFGGNEVRNDKGWYGNIGDANLKEWSNTISKVKAKYGDAKIVIPGHGKYGGTELLDYTIGLYKPHKWGGVLKYHNIEVPNVFNDCGDIFEIADSMFIVDKKRYLNKAMVFIMNNDRYIKVQSPTIVHEPDTKMVSSGYGRLQIYNRKTNEIIEDLYYNQLYVNLRDDEVGWTIIIKDAIR
jgi:hypothetical protein